MKKAILVFLALIVLGGAFVVLKPNTQQLDKSKHSAKTLPSTQAFELVIRDRKLVTGSALINVAEGDDVTIDITDNEDEEFHLHGYDISVDLQKDRPTQLHFVAKLTGNFSFELEKSKTELGSVQVQPN